MIDVHCHCLPGLDDGPATLADAIALCEALVADGVTTAVATPHQLGRYAGTTTPALIRQALETLRYELKSRSIPLDLVTGADVRIHEDLANLIASRDVLTIADGGRYLLLEMPHEVFIDGSRLVQSLSGLGIRVVLTHPERYHWIRRHIAQMLTWRTEFGALLQMTAGSLTGDFGPEVGAIAWQLAESGVVDLVASDSHAARGPRRPRMSAARELVVQRLGEATATEWFETVPGKLISPANPC